MFLTGVEALFDGWDRRDKKCARNGTYILLALIAISEMDYEWDLCRCLISCGCV